MYFSALDKNIDLHSLADHFKLLENDIAFIAGSLVEGDVNPYSKGMGNRLSDIDVFIIRQNSDMEILSGADYSFSGIQGFFHDYERIGIDTEVYSSEMIDNLIDQLNSIDFSASEYAAKRLISWITLPDGIQLDKFLSFLHRLRYSICIWNIEGYTQLKEKINYKKYFQYQSLLYIEKADIRFEDIAGNIESGEYLVAVVAAREVMTFIIASYLFAQLESIDREKWIPLRLKNLAQKNIQTQKIYTRYFELICGSKSHDNEALREHAEDMIAFSNFVVRQIRNLT